MQIPVYPQTYFYHLLKTKQFKEYLNLLSELNMSVYKFMSFKNAKKCIKDSYIFLSNASSFNDAFDCTIQPPFLIINNETMPFKVSKANINIFRNFNYVSCFTEECNLLNPVMWERYADKGEGVVLEYSALEIVKKLVTYNSHVNKIVSIFCPVQYSNTTTLIPFTDSWNELLHTTFVKNGCWSHEHEWRICCQYLPFQNGIVLMPIIPKAIYLGPNCKQISTTENKIPIFKITEDFVSKTLTVKEITSK